MDVSKPGTDFVLDLKILKFHIYCFHRGSLLGFLCVFVFFVNYVLLTLLSINGKSASIGPSHPSPPLFTSCFCPIKGGMPLLKEKNEYVIPVWKFFRL